MEPKFHQMEILMGVGRLRRLCFNKEKIGSGVLRGLTIMVGLSVSGKGSEWAGPSEC